jgi:purine-nucleoside/S-methyl-5'-thioadenosine phosphorylase / adenosine deaminase
VGSPSEVALLEWPGAEQLGASIAVTTRHGGVSEGPYATLNLGLHVGDDPDRVRTNRERAARAFGVEIGAMVFADQVHGAGVAVVGPSERGRGTRHMEDAIGATDILVTTDPGTVVVILVADCVPLALVDPVARILAVVHAGWRGTAAGATTLAVEAMTALGGRPDRIAAFLGPAVPPEAYQVDSIVRDGLAGAIGPHELHPGVARADGPDRWRVDLVAANRQQLGLAGVAPGRIAECGTSTAQSDFFSDRAARPCGRFGLMAQLDAP